jgi:hypothetical protein
MAAQGQRQLRETVDFPLDVPVTVSLRYSEGKVVSGAYGERVMYSLADNRVMFVDQSVAQQISDLGINVRESFTLTRKGAGQKGGPVTWEIARVPGEQANGTLVIPKATPTESAGGGGAERKPARRASASESLVDEANSLVDAYAKVLERTLTTYQGRIKPEEARALLVTAYIQRSKLSSVA